MRDKSLSPRQNDENDVRELDKWRAMRRNLVEDYETGLKRAELEVEEDVAAVEFWMDWLEEQTGCDSATQTAAGQPDSTLGGKHDDSTANRSTDDRRLEQQRNWGKFLDELSYPELFDDDDDDDLADVNEGLNIELRQLGERAIELCLFAIRSGNQRVRANGRRFLTRIGQNAVPKLIDSLRKNTAGEISLPWELIQNIGVWRNQDLDRPPFAEQCADVLRQITGKDFGTSVRKWRAWWKSTHGNNERQQ